LEQVGQTLAWIRKRSCIPGTMLPLAPYNFLITKLAERVGLTRNARASPKRRSRRLPLFHARAVSHRRC